ncbi:MAG: Stk1 family PASTA domain-containing Ser/Thr kinase [Erysipelotrichaceae bacterium]|nr:Stk1 family PASTA domain-containing Ser/Thr kinase [Erysipelotrichaceae bacterium]
MTDNTIGKRYQIIKLIGKGGMADVFLAHDTILGRDVAVKIMHGDLSGDEIALERFRREANASTSLSHPNIVDIYDVGEDNGRYYIVMEYVQGFTLKKLIQKRVPLPTRESVWLMGQLASALAEAHRNGIIHRDVKSQNVLIKPDGTVKLSDFGIALANDAMQITGEDAVIGSVHYLAPECVKGGQASVQSDIYSLGIVFYEVLTGDVPFKGDQAVKIAMKHIKDVIPSVRAYRSDVPQSVENIIIKATAKDLSERYKSISEMIADLSVCLKEEHKNDPKLIVREPELEKERKRKQQEEEDDDEKQPLNYTVLIGIISVVSILLVLIVLFLSGIIGGKSKLVKVPDIQGMTVIEAQDSLDEYGLTVDYSNITREMTESTEAGLIIRFTPEKDTEVEKGTKIEIVVSEGVYETMEDLTGKNIEVVREQLAGKNFRIEAKPVESDELPGTIVLQEGVKPNEKYNPNTINYITLSYSEYPTILIQFGTVGRPVDEVYNELTDAGFTVYTNTVDRSTLTEKELGYGANHVVRINPDEGNYFRQEGNAAIYLYYYEGE